jgi:hypothetical protein
VTDEKGPDGDDAPRGNASTPFGAALDFIIRETKP